MFLKNLVCIIVLNDSVILIVDRGIDWLYLGWLIPAIGGERVLEVFIAGLLPRGEVWQVFSGQGLGLFPGDHPVLVGVWFCPRRTWARRGR